MKAWLVRAGEAGQRDDHCLASGVVAPGFSEIGDLSGSTSRDAVAEIVRAALPQAKESQIRNFTAQLWAFTNRIDVGDLVVLPLKTVSQLAIGRVIGPYEYRAGELQGSRHIRPVEWIRTDLPRSAAQQDLLYSLGAFMTICEISRNDAARRVETLSRTGADPGSAATMPAGARGGIEEPSGIDVEQYAFDRLSAVIGERFAGHGLARLIGSVLEAHGFVCDVSPPGPDGGIDILAGKGPFGLEAPRVVVQVKSGTTPVDAPTVRELHGVISTHGADQGLMVAWGGISAPARRELGTQRFSVRVWDARDVIEQVTSVYAELPEDVRAELPLKQIWSVVEDPAAS